MEILFKNQTTLNKSVTVESCKVLVRPYIRYILLIAAFVYTYLAIDGYLLRDYIMVIICLFSMSIVLILRSHIYRVYGGRAYKQQRVLFGDKDPIINITVFKDYLELSEDFFKANQNSLLISKNDLEADISHEHITSVYKTKNLFVIIYQKQFALKLEKDKFTEGSPEGFEEFLLTKGIKVKQK